MCLQHQSLKTVGKGEFAHYEQFLLFPVFSTHLKNFVIFIKFANAFILGESKICHMGKGIENIIFHSVFYQTNQKPYFDLYLNLSVFFLCVSLDK